MDKLYPNFTEESFGVIFDQAALEVFGEDWKRELEKAFECFAEIHFKYDGNM